MNGLLRIHFASIGHRDARLAPLTLDLRDEQGHATDSVLWLRNGGGKSSILNLFYSVFRPNRREFLGAHAEGRSRHIEDYVQGRDLAVIVTEWSLPGQSGLPLPGLESSTLVVGQCLGWQGQQRSPDATRLRQLFFSLRTGDGLRFEDLPVEGLGAEPQRSWEAFRDWLSETARARTELQVVYETAKGRWQRHLEQLGLDPELFRYQLRMNQREGAADEQFRFGRAEDFVRFFLELALDTSRADQVSTNLQELRDQLERKPELELEQRFLQAAGGALQPLVAAVNSRDAARRKLDACMQEAGGFCAGLRAAQTELRAQAAAASRKAEDAENQRRLTANRRDLLRRQSRGLERRAVELNLEEAHHAHEAADENRAAADRAVRLHEAAVEQARLDAMRAQERALLDALRQEQSDREPLRRSLARAAGVFAAVIDREVTRVRETSQEVADQVQDLDQAITGAERSHSAHLQKQGTLEGRVETLRQRISERDRSRETLRQDGHLDDREEIGAAIERHQEARERTLSLQAQLDHQIVSLRQDQEQLSERIAATREARVGHEAEAGQLDGELQQARKWAARLASHPRLVELEEAEPVNLHRPGLVARVLEQAEGLHRRELRLAVDGAEDERAVSAVERTGLLPASPDVERLLQATAEQGLHAFAGAHWLKDNLPPDQRRQAVLAGPARFMGVLVHDAAALERVAALDPARLGLRGPVQVSVTSLPEATPQGDAVVLPPASEGAWDEAAARDEQEVLQGRLRARQRDAQGLLDLRQQLEAVVGDLERFLATWGEDRMDRHAQRLDAARAQQQAAEERLSQLAKEGEHLRRRLAEVEAEQKNLDMQREQATLALQALGQHQETHERHLSSWRQELDTARQKLELSRREVERLKQELTAWRGARDDARGRLALLETERGSLVKERSRIGEQEAPASPPEQGIDAARSTWRTLDRQWSEVTGNSRVQGQLDQVKSQLADLEGNLDRLGQGLDSAALQQAAASGEGSARRQLEAARDRKQAAVEAVGKATAAVEAIEARLAELGGRREAEDLPDEAPPETAAAARARAGELKEEAERLSSDIEAAERQRDKARERAQQAEASANRVETEHKLIAATLGEVPVAPSVPVPASADELEARAARIREDFSRLSKALDERKEAARSCAVAVQGIAHDGRYAEHRSQVRERLRDDAPELMQRASELEASIQERLVVLARRMEELHQHQAVLVGALDGVAGEALRLLNRANRASRLPEEMDAWAGQPFLQIRLRVPTSEAERHARLGVLVEELVAKATLPGGLELAQQAVETLAGSRGIDVTVLKPDAVLRPDRLPIAAMSTFSRGQQLTAAVLLYCTLVQLRARSRGRGTGAQDAGVLVLDNPIGTCSSVPLLELQRRVARQMRVQLVYTTGVHDLDALGTLPNVVRLRNTHRNRHTGDHHVTREGAVEGVRVHRKEPALA